MSSARTSEEGVDERAGAESLDGLGLDGRAGAPGRPAPAAGPAAEPRVATGPPRGPRRGPEAMRVALGEVGVREEPPGSNAGPRVDVYTGGSAGAWCAHFVSWCLEQSGGSPFGHKAWVPSLRDWAKRRGCWYPNGSVPPEPGDIFTMARYDKLGKYVGGHTGYVVEGIDGGRRVRTVEGNADDRVKRTARSLEALEGLIKL